MISDIYEMRKEGKTEKSSEIKKIRNKLKGYLKKSFTRVSNLKNKIELEKYKTIKNDQNISQFEVKLKLVSNIRISLEEIQSIFYLEDILSTNGIFPVN